MSNKPTRGKGMKPKIKTISAEDLKKFLEKDGLLFTSQDLAKMLGVTEGALRKQRSKNRSIFKFAKLGGRIFYPADVVMETIHNNLQQGSLR
ncbi:MAG: helix-turn-helix domain-containing protein [Candidatus Pelagibacterales bacterium]|jgi:hypothetical protein|nr:helix-turn-helix domain-containing protein [Candidatus Pelagibacter sp.]MDB9799820.1 helix-turn-helix domain-containing protein [Candidatus Pelagibacter sp.]|tara:strand:- start:914 stop:1189 length:276 start_codon:yes stop_codon:yes gene_type:complete